MLLPFIHVHNSFCSSLESAVVIILLYCDAVVKKVLYITLYITDGAAVVL